MRGVFEEIKKPHYLGNSTATVGLFCYLNSTLYSLLKQCINFMRLPKTPCQLFLYSQLCGLEL